MFSGSRAASLPRIKAIGELDGHLSPHGTTCVRLRNSACHLDERQRVIGSMEFQNRQDIAA